jgi:hypothetical protein
MLCSSVAIARETAWEMNTELSAPRVTPELENLDNERE